MKLILKISYLTLMAVIWSLGFVSLPAFAQNFGILPAPSKAEVARKKLAAEIEIQRNALFDDPENAELHRKIAKKYLAQGSADIAENELKRALALGTPLDEILVDLGKAYLKRGKFEQIIQEILIELARIGDYGEIYLILGRAHYKQGNIEAAFENLRAAKNLIDDQFDLNATLAQVYNLYGDYENAEINVDKALGFQTTNVDMLMLKGELVHRKFGSKNSYGYFERAAFYQPDNISAQIKVAGVLYNLQLDEQAFKHLNRILKSDKSHGLANFMAAVISARKNNKTAALKYLTNARDGLDEFAPGLLLKAQLSFDKGLYADVENSLTKLLAIDESHVQARRLLGASYLFENKNSDAVQILEYITKNNMAEDVDYMLLTSAYLQDHDYDKANQYFKWATDSDIDQLSHIQKISLDDFNLGNEFGVKLNIVGIINQNYSSNQQQIFRTFAALKVKKYDQAFESAVQIVERDRRNPVGYNLLGLAYAGLGKFDEAISNYRRAITLDRNFHSARLNIAKLEYNQGKKNNAITTINEILKRDESYIPAYELLSEFAMMDNDYIRSERYLITAINADPNVIEIRQKLVNFYINQKNISKAITLANDMEQRFPDHYISYKSMGRVNLANEDYSASAANFEQALLKNQSDDELYLLLCDVYIKNDQVPLARPLLQKGLLHVKDTMPLIKKLIDLAATDGNYSDSYRFIDQLKLNENTKSMAFFYQGDLNMTENRAKDAINSYQSAFKAGGSENKAEEAIAKARELLSVLQ